MLWGEGKFSMAYAMSKLTYLHRSRYTVGTEGRGGGWRSNSRRTAIFAAACSLLPPARQAGGSHDWTGSHGSTQRL